MAPLLSAEDIKMLGPLIRATWAYFMVYYTFMIFQSFAKYYVFFSTKKKNEKSPSLREVKYEQKRGLALLADRTFLNMLEQSVPLITSTWLYGLVVDPTFASTLVYIYLFFRLPYPLLFKLGPPFIFLSTGPNYCVIGYALVKTGLASLAA
ncbi:hypothetical protein CTAYLR_008122 [Chrysophaeum taylorii]|uniref:Uncharacterized protein n=1 Tax=Chrysophaeum taylorii TaxID=2483200 RepID=A0AAD7ULU7_9STRA|nr:hypothetical protein CTAYLR_008122 [Chrysophaeum taylorii]